MKVFLQIKNIKKHFGEGESRVEVLKGIDIEIEKGEFCVLLGPSGSGKSTLLNIYFNNVSLPFLNVILYIFVCHNLLRIVVNCN